MHCRKEVSMSRYSAQQSSISENNRSRILQYLYHNGICSRAQIAKAIKLTPAAITKITAKLLAQGIIEETGDMDGDKNRRSIGLNLNCAKYHIIGVKFARSLVQIAVFDLKCNRIFLSDLPTVSEEHIPETVERIRDTVRQLIKDDPSIVAVGMAVPGPYLKDEGRTALVSSMQGWRQINFIDEFSNAFSVPVFVEQDARAGALAQFLFNPELSEGSLAYYLLGEGIGLGVIDNGTIYYGEHGTATEIGHVSIDVNGKPCDCGNVGCLERYCSANAIHEQLNANPSIVPGCETMTHAQACAALFAKANAGDETATLLMLDVARYVGYGAVTIINAFNPTHRSWRHHRASRPAVARRSHTSRARTHDPRNRAQHPNHPVRPCPPTPPSPVPPPWPSPIFWNIHRCSSTSHSTPPTKERNHPCPSQSSSPSVKSCGICSPTGKRAGGAPVNFAYHASQNGAESYAISAVGNDELGAELLNDAHKAGINTLVQTNEYPTGTVAVALTNGIPEYTIVQNVAWDHIGYTDELAEAVSKADAICFGTLGLRSQESHDTIIKLLQHTKEGALKFFDINLRANFYPRS